LENQKKSLGLLLKENHKESVSSKFLSFYVTSIICGGAQAKIMIFLDADNVSNE
jgi:hypothetical protein